MCTGVEPGTANLPAATPPIRSNSPSSKDYSGAGRSPTSREVCWFVFRTGWLEIWLCVKLWVPIWWIIQFFSPHHSSFWVERVFAVSISCCRQAFHCWGKATPANLRLLPAGSSKYSFVSLHSYSWMTDAMKGKAATIEFTAWICTIRKKLEFFSMQRVLRIYLKPFSKIIYVFGMCFL